MAGLIPYMQEISNADREVLVQKLGLAMADQGLTIGQQVR
jgi:hypothetical protein